MSGFATALFIAIEKCPIKCSERNISSLFDGNINISKIREIAGYEDEKTSLNSYCFNRSDNKEIEEKLEQINLLSNLKVNYI